jgi:hypothetical protein
VETKKEKEIMRRKKWNNWRETKTGLFVFSFLFPQFFSPAARTNGSANPAILYKNLQKAMTSDSTSNDDQPHQRTNSFFNN